MKTYCAAFFLLLSSFCASGIDRMQFKISKPFAVLVFVRAAGDDPRLSATLRKYIHSHSSYADSVKLHRLSRQLSTIDMEVSFVYPNYPTQRQKPKNLSALINNAAIQSNDISVFMARISGILPNEQWLQLKHVLTAAEPLYDRMMGTYRQDLEEQLLALQEFTEAAGHIFYKLKTFYGSTWSNDVPFIISLYPIPGHTGNTTASPYNNTLALGVLTEETTHEERMGVALHEVSHVLYEEQPLSLQQKIDAAFLQSTAPYAPFAYNYFDEALATACGNGWAYRQMAGKDDSGNWYSYRYINDYGKALYPLVTKYVESGREMDVAFVNQAIAIFGKTFPRAVYEYANLLNNVSIFSDAQKHEEYANACRGITRYFQITRSNGYYPVSDNESMAQLRNAEGTIVVIVHQNHKATYHLLMQVFPQLQELNPNEEGVASFYDQKKRAVIIINAKNVANVMKVAAKMSKMAIIDTNALFTPLN